MKKCIFPVILLALLSGCGKVSDSNGGSRISIVSGTVEGTTREVTTSETEANTEEDTTKERTTTTKHAGEKVSGTTATTTKKNSIQPATRASHGGSGGVHGTTRAVPTAPRTTTTTAQPSTQSPTFDPKDFNSVSFGFDSSAPNKIEVSRPYTDGKTRSYQVLSVDTSKIKAALEADQTKTINDFVVRGDFDFDGYTDLFIVEDQDDLNKTGKYYRYDPDNGTFSQWNELNNLTFNNLPILAETEDLSRNEIVICHKNEDRIEYEKKTYKWNEYKALVLREHVHQYKDSEERILIETITYDEGGAEISRETRDSQGNLIGGETEQPQAE